MADDALPPAEETILTAAADITTLVSGRGPAEEYSS